MKNKPSKDNNQFKVDYDFPGCCVLCHIEVAEFSGSHPNGRPIIKEFKGNLTQMKLELSDKSEMTVILCNHCHDNFLPEDMKPLLESVIAGWQAEVNCLSWHEDKKLDHMTKYSKLQIIDRADFPMSEEDKKRIQPADIDKLNIRVNKESTEKLIGG